MQRNAVKTSLFAAEEREHKLDRKGDLLAVLSTHVDVAALAVEMDRLAPRPSETRGGRPPYPTEVMVRVLILQQLYGLSDDALEFQLLDRLSLQRFCGLRQSSSIPDARTVWVFRERIREAGGAEALFNAVQVQLQRHGYLARGGQIIDASLVRAPIQHVNKEEHVSTAREHDTKHFEQVLDPLNTSRDVWADKGYQDAGLSAMGGKILRTIGLACSEFGLDLKAAVYNLRRLCSLKEGGVVPF